ncbi:MAG: hypothetical protein ACXVGC_08180 [Mycobacteriaceae bacterium]
MNEQRGSVGTDREVTPGASRPKGGSVWSYISLLVALSCALGITASLGYDIPSGLAFSWLPLTLLGVVAGIVGVSRDQRVLWRVLGALSALFCFLASGAPTLFLWLLLG